jgi:hypothetical protein
LRVWLKVKIDFPLLFKRRPKPGNGGLTRPKKG